MIFTIKQGAHYPSPSPVKFLDSSKPRSGTFKIFSSCWYDTVKYGTHLNKIVGVGCDLLNSNSYRISCRPHKDRGKFEVFIYLHIDGKWVRSTPMKNDLCAIVHEDVENTWAFMPDQDDDGSDLIRLVVNGDDVVRHFPVNMGTGWLMKPYFGGKPTAPWIMQMDVTMEGVV
jgi:hypothetical protein